MSYDLYISPSAERDIEAAADYIEHVLLNPQATDALLDAIDETLPTLMNNPERIKPVSDPILNAWGIRFIQVRNYMAFFTVDIPARSVNIVRFLYCRRNWQSILREEL